MIKYFKYGLKPSIQAKIDQKATWLDDYEGLVAKVIKTKAKIGLQPSFHILKTNQNYF